MKKAAIIGCGFAGVSAAGYLSRFRKELEVTVFDKGDFFNFLPLLPDALGRNISPEYLIYPVERLSREMGFRFIKAEAQSVDPGRSLITVSGGSFEYDYLIIAAGSETNFYGNEQIRKHAFKLDDAADAKKIAQAIRERDFNAYIIAGGGYTGIEVATNLRRYLNRLSRDRRIVIVERAAAILGPLPEWMRKYTAANLKALKIEVLTNSAVEQIEENALRLSNREVFEHSLLVWAAGVKTPGFVQGLQMEKNPQGRLKADAYLRIAPNIFAAGDSAYFGYKGNFLRMAVQFAITQGACAAENVVRGLRRQGLKEYRPVDLGYVIPMANNRSCGKIFGVDLKGRIPTFLHYLMCVYRSYGYANQSGIVRGLLRK